MTIDISDNNPRIDYAVAEGVVQTVFAIPFEFFEDSDVFIYVDGTLKTLGSDYTLSGGDGSTGTATFVTATPPAVQQVTGATGGSTVSIVRHVSLERTTDFVAGQEINRASLNEQLDIITAQISDLDSKVNRTIQLNDYEIAPSTLLPEDRNGRTLAFDETTGAVVAGPLLANLDIIADNIDGILSADNAAVAAALSLLDGVTASTEELNILDGLTSSTSELNTLDGITSSTAELNLLDGVTVTLADITATAAELNLLAGTSATADEIDHLSGVTSAIQTQLDAKAPDNELTQIEVEDDTSTVFGQVSGERLAQANSAGLADLATGAVGSPRILGKALAAPADVPTITVSAADTVVRAGSAALGLGYVEGTTSTTGSTYVVGATFTVSQAYSGSLRFYATQTSQYTGGGSGSATSSMYLRKNGVTVSSVFTVSGNLTGSGTATRSFDSAVVNGDVFEWMHSNSGLGISKISDVEIGGSDLYVAALPMIKASESPF